jgi:UDP:flavonoid glycosyltransferase YjiC (YdhE family)
MLLLAIHRLARQYSNGYLPGTGPYRPLLLLVNFDWALEAPRPVAPNTVYLGGLMPKPPAVLPEDIRIWLEGTDGSSDALLPTVYISFGSSFLAPDEFMPAVAQAVNATVKHMRFLLRLRTQEQEAWETVLQRLSISVSPNEVFIRESYPQNDLLGHPSVTAFVTQGGYLSIQEAGYHAVPVVAVPFTLGQTELAQHAQDHGRGVVVHKEGLMKGDPKPLTAALMEVVTKASYKEQVSRERKSTLKGGVATV